MERLQKILAHAGVASRRKCEELIVAGHVRVNSKIVRELGTQVDPVKDRIEVDGTPIRIERLRYVILHKPKGYLSDIDESRGKPLAIDLVPSDVRLYAAGRLDANSEGLLLLTNDGELAHRITHPRYQNEKEYLALVEGEPNAGTFARAKEGVLYDGDLLRVDSARIARHLGVLGEQHHWGATARNECWVRLVLHEGKKREIRHLFGALGHPVKRLIRVRIGPIELGDLPVGKWRDLTNAEVRALNSSGTEKT